MSALAGDWSILHFRASYLSCSSCPATTLTFLDQYPRLSVRSMMLNVGLWDSRWVFGMYDTRDMSLSRLTGSGVGICIGGRGWIRLPPGHLYTGIRFRAGNLVDVRIWVFTRSYLLDQVRLLRRSWFLTFLLSCWLGVIPKYWLFVTQARIPAAF